MDQELIYRIEKLERQNRLLKGLGGCALLLGLASFVAPTLCDTVWAERFVLRNSSDTTRMTIDAYRTENPTITFHDIKGKAQSRLVVHRDGRTLDFSQDGKKKTWSTKAKQSCNDSESAAIE